MMVSLINLGDSPRVFFDRKMKPVVVGIGKTVRADMAETTLKQITRFKKVETLLVFPEGEVIRIPNNVMAAVELMSIIDHENYDTALRRFQVVIPPKHITETRPNRIQMKTHLKALVDKYVRRLNADTPEPPASVLPERTSVKIRENDPPPSNKSGGDAKPAGRMSAAEYRRSRRR